MQLDLLCPECSAAGNHQCTVSRACQCCSVLSISRIKQLPSKYEQQRARVGAGRVDGGAHGDAGVALS